MKLELTLEETKKTLASLYQTGQDDTIQIAQKILKQIEG